MKFAVPALLLLSACHAGRDPQQSLDRYLQETSRGNFDAAYLRLSSEFRRQCDKPCFIRMVESHPGSSRQLLDELRSGKSSIVYQAEIKLRDGTQLHLEQAAEAATSASKAPPPPFLFTDNPLDFYPQDSPARALRSFVRAFSAQRFDVLLRFVPKSLESKLNAEALRTRFQSEPRISTQVDAVRQHLADPIAVEGNVAKLVTGPEQEATLVLEEGRWRIQKLE